MRTKYGDAALVAAYSMLKCGQLFGHQHWEGSRLTPVQRQLSNKYPQQDFKFWVRYGSWSLCPHCGSVSFNDKYFREAVYQNQQTSSTPDFLSVSRRTMPQDPMEHAYGAVGESSRWWYLPGMYHPISHCGRCTKPRKVT